MEGSKYLSVIVPVYNEEESVPKLHENISRVLMKQDFSYEVIYVDDGSKDTTFIQLRQIAEKDRHVKVVQLRRNFGQTAGIAAGVANSTGEILVFMDGDLQNDPIDIPRLLAKLEEGYDVVSGWRKNRQDAQLSRKLPSMLANRLISKVTGVHLHDYGCSLKAYRRTVFQHIRLYGEMHRFLPAYAAIAGAAITEMEVNHHARQFGKSKYGISRTFRVVLDLITVKFLSKYATKPSYAFGIPGLFSVAIGTALGIFSLGRKVLPPHVRIHRNPLLPLSILFTGFGMQCLMVGLLAELLMRTYHESQGKPIYVVRDVVSYEQPVLEERHGAKPILR
ncbi:glycosyltransferase family 2 protein [Tengunoibacter tsumagoiensis]|uniref:Glycosyl transferase n=1 Tax=Tengunoibacter tsumagoiensis TaxID=2014871 RepID=A0A401ZVI4_9CHLR|nr:glycosyltransferase family 2 protein [Tengunoibacter tsumagoiensis]GCE10903.1 glycosyl transferase [Tengunoibacter tsumagoiensis]